jgi:predicted DsbA family dithiol-disulfide isomerase
MKTGILIIVMIICLPLWSQSNTKQEMKEDKVTIEIWSDVVCPFCLLGKKKIERAIDKLDASAKVNVIWRSFQLDPVFPLNEAIPTMQNLAERKGYPVDQVKDMCANLTQQGKAYGIEFNFEKALTFNTFDTHRLIQWASSYGLSNDLKEAFMLAHFSAGVDLSKKGNVLEIIALIGLDKVEAKQVLDSDAYSANVKKDIQRADSLGISGVPFFLINGNQGISGAQQDHVFENVLSAAIKNLTPQSDTVGGGTCAPNKECK